MKAFIVILISCYVIFVGGVIVNNLTIKEIKSVQANIIVKIDRVVRLNSDPFLRIACNKAVLDYEKRTVTIEGLVSFAGDKNGDKWVVEKMEIKEYGTLVIYIPTDNDYEIRIGPQFHLLSKISK